MREPARSEEELRRPVAIAAMVAATLVVAGPASAEGAELTAVRSVALDVVELATGIDGELVANVDTEAIVHTANFVAAVASAEENDLLELDPESDTTEVEDGEGRGSIVRVVAHCAPRGRAAKDLFSNMKNHGAYVTAAAQGAVVDLDGATFDLSSLEGAEALCAHVAEVAPDAKVRGPKSAEDRAQAKADRTAARTDAKADRDAAKADRQATKAEAKADRAGGPAAGQHPGQGKAKGKNKR